MIKKFNFFFIFLSVLVPILFPKVSYAYPVFAQQGYQNPREATGNIVCANCHLARIPVEFKIPKGVLPDTVFEATATVPYDVSVKQITSDGTRGPVNIGAVLILPEGFKIAPKNRISPEIKSKTKNLFVQPYSKAKTNILVLGPVSGNEKNEFFFPILSPDPAQDKGAKFLKYPVYFGGNCGRGQIYPTGEKSNNTAFVSTVAGQVTSIEVQESGKTDVTIATSSGDVKQRIPVELALAVKVGDIIKVDQPLTLDPNVGGFGQYDSEIVLQNPIRVKGMIAFFFTITVTQILLVVKKRQYEKVLIPELEKLNPHIKRQQNFAASLYAVIKKNLIQK